MSNSYNSMGFRTIVLHEEGVRKILDSLEAALKKEWSFELDTLRKKIIGARTHSRSRGYSGFYTKESGK